MGFFDGVGRLLFAFTKQSGDRFLAQHPYSLALTARLVSSLLRKIAELSIYTSYKTCYAVNIFGLAFYVGSLKRRCFLCRCAQMNGNYMDYIGLDYI